jgi:hypothetical protein
MRRQQSSSAGSKSLHHSVHLTFEVPAGSTTLALKSLKSCTVVIHRRKEAVLISIIRTEATAIEFSTLMSRKVCTKTLSLTHLKPFKHQFEVLAGSTTRPPTLESHRYLTVDLHHNGEAGETGISRNEAIAVEFSPSVSRMGCIALRNS